MGRLGTLKKYRLAFPRVFFQQREIERLRKTNGLAARVADAFLSVKQANYTAEEREIFQYLKTYKDKLLACDEIITYEEFNSPLKRTVAEIAALAASPEKWCEFYYFLTKWSEAKNVLEIGTNLGVSGQYFIQGLAGRREQPLLRWRD